MRSFTILVLLVGVLALLTSMTQARRSDFKNQWADQLPPYQIPLRMEKWCPTNPLDERCSGYLSRVCPTDPGLWACRYYNLNQIQSLSDSQQLRMKTSPPGVKRTLSTKFLCSVDPNNPLCKRHVRPLSDIPWRRRL